ncbi:threonine dehydratase [Alteromonas facilis]|uniref:threonine dehydratase n=1 Tax=Alteromonas facilis TaxID=2048004 RepID=UPI000C28D375|nr:threonine dehydratase [Alteromonas facilis]
MKFTLSQLEAAAKAVYQFQPATPQYSWPLLNELMGTEVWVKHENHTSTGAFKVRGGITFMQWLRQQHPECRGIITATRGNHGQSQAKAATASGLTATIVVPEGNSPEKNSAMRAFGGEVITYGKDFDTAKQHAAELAKEQGLFMVPPFHHALVSGVASYALELFTQVQDIDRVYVPIGCGSGICGVIAARDALKLKTEVIGVVSANALAAKLSFDSGRMQSTESANTFADGVAVRVPVADAFDIYREGAARVVAVTDDEVAEAIRAYYRCTHNAAEGAGAVPLAAAMQERPANQGKKVAVILCGGNIDTELMQTVLSGQTPSL